MNRKTTRITLFLNDEQHGFATTVGPLDEQRNVQFPEAVAQPLFQLFLTKRNDPGVIDDPTRFFGGKKGQCLARIVKDKVFEVLVVGHRTPQASDHSTSEAIRLRFKSYFLI